MTPVSVSARTGRRRLTVSALALVSVFALAGCSSTKEEDLTLDETPPDVLYNQALASMQSGKNTNALKKFEDVDRLHPYSESAKKAIVMQAYTYYKKGDYTNAIQAAKRFATLYSGSPDAPYALFIIGESYYAQIADISRDQEMAQKAFGAYRDLVQRYPTSEYAEEARRKMVEAQDQMAAKEMDVGRYYLGKRQYIAAINRFKVVVSTYQTTRHIEEALARLVECYMALGVVPEAQTAAAILGHNYPDSKWYKDSYALLKNGGYEPEVSRGSWIAKTLNGIKLL